MTAVDTLDVENNDAEKNDAEKNDAEKNDAEKNDRQDTEPRLGPGAVRILTALVAIAAVLALVLGVLWVVAVNDESLELAQARDVVIVDARQAAINLNSLDFRGVDAGLDLWEQSSTAGLLEEFRTNRDEYAQVVTDSQRVTAATVTDAAVAELDVRAGVARVVVGVDVQVTAVDQEPTLFRQRLQIEMTRTDQGWKASKLEVVR